MSRTVSPANDYDVIILGSGMSGTQLGAILAKNRFRVLIIEESSHPRFTIGESTIPETSMMNRIIAERFGIPEIKHLASFYALSQEVASSTGIKRNFGFVHHEPGGRRLPHAFTQCIIPEIPFGPESHAFRQDVDAYLLQAAIRYGCVCRQATRIVEYDVSAAGVVLTSAKGERFTGRYLVDCGGPRAPLAVKFGLRDEPCRYRTHSRTLYTHMIDVRSFDEIFQMEGQRWKWDEGTLHHIFDGGWLWVIPFNNHPSSTNRLVSVGLQLDPRVHPMNDLPPQQEFDEFIARFPTIAAQFEHAKPVREWVKTDRLQFSSKRCVGDRYCLMLHATGFIDPLFSRGLENTAVTIHALAPVLMKALRDDDLSKERFAYIERLEQRLLDHNDDIVHACYIAFRDFRLWDAFHRVWSVGATMGTMRLMKAYAKFLETRDESWLDALDADPPYLGLLCADLKGYHDLFYAAAAEVEAVGDGRTAPDVAAARIHQLIAQSFANPIVGFQFCISGADPHRNHSRYNVIPALRLVKWGKRDAPPDIRRYFDYGPRAVVRELGAYLKRRITGRAPRQSRISRLPGEQQPRSGERAARRKGAIDDAID